MSLKRWAVKISGAAVLACIVGCATTGGNQVETTIYDMHRRVVKLDKDLGDSIAKLNETAATLNARVDEMDQQTRQMNLMLEDNQKKLSGISSDLNRFKADVYRHLGITTSAGPTGVGTSNVQSGQVIIDGPGKTAAPVPQNELSDSAPAPAGAGSQLGASPQPTDEPAMAAPPAAQDADPKAMYELAQRSYTNNDFKSALQQFDAYLAKFPNNDLSANAMFWKAKCQLNGEQYGDAVQTFEQLRAKFPNNSKVPFAMHNQAVAHSRLGQTAEAERLMQAVIDQFPMSPVAEQAKADLKKLKG